MKKELIEPENQINKLIVADTQKRKLFLYENGRLMKELEEVYFGKNGLSETKKEGDNCTPKGRFPLGFAFGTKKLKTNYPYFKINENIYWVSDPNSHYYNNWVEITEEKKESQYSYQKSTNKITWNSHEHLIDYPVQYELALVIEYNINSIIPGLGSAIFLHVKKKDITAGCIATSKENMLAIVKWIENEKAEIQIQ